MLARNIVCSAATATKEETFTYQAEVGPRQPLQEASTSAQPSLSITSAHTVKPDTVNIGSCLAADYQQLGPCGTKRPLSAVWLLIVLLLLLSLRQL